MRRSFIRSEWPVLWLAAAVAVIAGLLLAGSAFHHAYELMFFDAGRLGFLCWNVMRGVAA